MEAGPPTTDADVEGIDRDRVTEWMSANVAGAKAPFG
jgi:hypothetical protein